MAVMIVFFVAGTLIVLYVLSRVASDSGGDENEGGGGGSRGDGGSPRKPKPHSPEPGWWPEFERDFRSYVQAQGRRETVSGAG